MRNKLFKSLIFFFSSIFVIAFCFYRVSYADEVVSGKCGENMTWTYDGNGTLTISGSGKMQLGEASWLELVDRNNIKAVVLPNGITSIDEWAFCECNISSIDIPETVTVIGECAFYRCSNLKNIVLPNTLKKIESRTFKDCANLASVLIPNSVSSIEYSAFEGCTSLTSISIPDDVDFMGHAAFAGCKKLTSLKLPSSLTTISGELLESCYGLTSVSIPKSVTKIESYAFDGCSQLASVNYDGTANEWSKITIQDGNENIKNAVINLNDNQYSILCSYNSTGGSVSVKSKAYPSENVTIELTPSAYYTIGTVSLMVDGNTNEIKPDSNGKYSFVMPASTVRVVVSFEKIPYYKIDVKETTAGTVTAKSSAAEGEEVKLSIKPVAGYEFAYFTLNGKKINDTKFIMPAEDVVIRVYFDRGIYKITVAEVTNGSLCVSTKTAIYLQTVKVTATPNVGYDFDYILVNGKKRSGTSFEMPSEDVTVEAVFVAHDLVFVPSKEPKCTSDGNCEHYKCRKCNKVFSDKDGMHEISESVVISRLGHQLEFVSATPPTKTSTGTYEHYKCTRCGSRFKDSDGKQLVFLENLVIPMMVHDLTFVKSEDATCTADGHIEYYECEDADCGCKKLYSDPYGQHEINIEDTIKPSLGHNPIEVNAKEATCTEDGYEKYYKCSRCHKLFSDAEGKNEIEKPVAILKLGHDMKHVEAKRPTHDDDGHIEYYHCNRCGKNFIDAEGSKVLTDVELVVPRIGAATLGEEITEGDFVYKVTNPRTDGTGTVTIIGVANVVESVVIPATVELKLDTYKVNRIGPKAFYGDKTVKTVYIGNNVVIIDTSAFYGCSNLIKVSGGKVLKTIGANAFARCPKLNTFVITSNVLYKIGPQTFYKDSKLKTIYIKNTTKLSKGGVKKSLKGSSVKTVKVKKSKVKKYKKYFTKKNAGRKVKIKK